jgi:hypothetical protein
MKRARGGSWVMKHPECPDLAEATLYKVWAGAGVRNEDELGNNSKLQNTHKLDTDDADTRASIQGMLRPVVDLAVMDGSMQSESGKVRGKSN